MKKLKQLNKHPTEPDSLKTRIHLHVVKLLWLGLAALALALLPGVNTILYAIGPNPVFYINSLYIQVGNNKYYLFSLTNIAKYIILIISIIVVGYFETRRGVKPRGGPLLVGGLAVVLSAPLPLVFSEQSGLTLIALSNAFSSVGSLVFLLAGALELAEHYMLPPKTTVIVAMPESALEKTEKT